MLLLSLSLSSYLLFELYKVVISVKVTVKHVTRPVHGNLHRFLHQSHSDAQYCLIDCYIISTDSYLVCSLHLRIRKSPISNHFIDVLRMEETKTSYCIS